MIVADNINKIYRVGAKPLQVLYDVSLRIAAGESLAIMGPSGAGKSTLLHILGGLDKPSSGVLRFKGEDLYRLPDARRNLIRARQVGFVFQAYHLLPELDIVENVMLPAMGLPGAWRQGRALRQRAADLLAAVGLGERLAHTPLELSGGEQQRVALARSLMNAPELLLTDEPTGNLDTGTGEQILHYLYDLTCQMNHTLVLVTHNAQVAARCHSLIRLVDGRVQSA
jgi:predicted ABC-type transport system involved in lysophospholipase L1 biosynthesis ATPase subunit